MSVIEPERPDGAASNESDALVEFLGKQDLNSKQELSSEQELQEYIRNHNDLLFIRSEKSEGEPAPRQTAELADPTWSFEPMAGRADAGEPTPQTKEARGSKPRLTVATVNTSIFFAFWLLLLVIAVRFIEFPLNYIMGAAFIAPVIIRLLPLLRNVRQSS